MDAAPQIVNLSPAAMAAAPPIGTPGAIGRAAEDPGTFSAAMAAVEEVGPESAAGLQPAAEETGVAVPEGGNGLPFVAGLLPSALPPPAAPAALAAGEAVAAGPQLAAPVAAGPSSGSPGANAVAGALSAAPPGQDPARDPVAAGPGAAVSRDPAAAGGEAWPAAAVAQRQAAPVAATDGSAPPSDAMTEVSVEAAEPSPAPLAAVPRAPVAPVALREIATRPGAPPRGPVPLDNAAAPALVAAEPERPAVPEVELPLATEALSPASAESPQPVIVAATALPGPRPADPPPVMQLATPVANPGWSEGLADRVAWMIQQDLGQAHLKLNPPQLGPLEVRVQVSGDQATVTFTAHNQQVREALEGASQRLREQLGSQGFVNVQVDVGQHAFHERPLPAQRYDEGMAETRLANGPSAPATAVRGSRALLDAYA